MPHYSSNQSIAPSTSEVASEAVLPPDAPDSIVPWHTFDDMLRRLHREHIYIHPEQLAEFLVRHGLPVDLRYVPQSLQPRAKVINANYQGDMARLENIRELPDLFSFD